MSENFIQQLLTEKDGQRLLRLIYHHRPPKTTIKRMVLEMCSEHVDSSRPLYRSCAEMATCILGEEITTRQAYYHLNNDIEPKW